MIKTARGIQKISSKIFLEHSNSSNYYRFGVEVFGPFLYSYTYWLYSSIKKTKQLKVFFLSRDGYMMKKAFDILNTDNIPCEYVYFSRKSIRQALLNKCNTYSESLQYLTWERYLTFGKILEYYGFSENERFEISKKYKISLKADFAYSGLEDNKVLASIYYDLKSEIDKYSMLQEELLEKYLIQINMDGNCAIVDIGWHGSMQFYLEKFIKEKGMNVSLSGYYVGINPNVPLAGKTYGYLFDENNLRLRKSILCFFGGYEKLFQSLEGSTYGYVKENARIIPELSTYEYQNDKKSIQCIKEWQYGAMKFVEKAYQLKVVLTNEKEWAYPLIKVGKSPTLEQVYLFKFLYNVDGTKVYYICQKPLYKYSIKEFLHDFSNSVWKTGFMKSAFKLPLPYYWIYEMIRK